MSTTTVSSAAMSIYNHSSPMQLNCSLHVRASKSACGQADACHSAATGDVPVALKTTPVHVERWQIQQWRTDRWRETRPWAAKVPVAGKPPSSSSTRKQAGRSARAEHRGAHFSGADTRTGRVAICAALSTEPQMLVMLLMLMTPAELGFALGLRHAHARTQPHETEYHYFNCRDIDHPNSDKWIIFSFL